MEFQESEGSRVKASGCAAVAAATASTRQRRIWSPQTLDLPGGGGVGPYHKRPPLSNIGALMRLGRI
jgi:hypothetical protein